MLLKEMFNNGDKDHYKMVRDMLMASYAYYFLFEEIMQDTTYDFLCRDVADIFRQLPKEVKQLLGDNSFGRTGSLFYLKKEQYPQDVVEDTLKLINN